MDYDLHDDFDLEGFDDEFMYEDEFDEYEWEKAPNGAKSVASKKKKEVAKKAVEAILRTTAKSAGLPPAVARQKAAVTAQKAVAKVEQESYEGLYESYDDELFEIEDEIGADLWEEMQELADLAAEAESESESDEFLGILGGLAAKAAPMLLKAAPGIISSILGEEEYGDGYSYEGALYEDPDEFLGAIASIAKQVLPKVVGVAGRALRSSGAQSVIRDLPGMAMSAAKRTVMSGDPTPWNFAKNFGLQAARKIMRPRRRRRFRRHYGYATPYAMQRRRRRNRNFYRY